MSETKIATEEPRSLAKGAIAGLIGGVVGIVAMTYAERIASSQQVEPQPNEESQQAEPIRWAFGATVGAAYGAVAELYPIVTAKEGATLGMALGTLNHERVLPAGHTRIVGCWPFLWTTHSRRHLASGPSTGVHDETTREVGNEVSSYVVFGVATELVRRLVRRCL
jgi:putative membrane protein